MIFSTDMAISDNDVWQNKPETFSHHSVNGAAAHLDLTGQLAIIQILIIITLITDN